MDLNKIKKITDAEEKIRETAISQEREIEKKRLEIIDMLYSLECAHYSCSIEFNAKISKFSSELINQIKQYFLKNGFGVQISSSEIVADYKTYYIRITNVNNCGAHMYLFGDNGIYEDFWIGTRNNKNYQDLNQEIKIGDKTLTELFNNSTNPLFGNLKNDYAKALEFIHSNYELEEIIRLVKINLKYYEESEAALRTEKFYIHKLGGISPYNNFSEFMGSIE